jgi:hypothetical protein
MCPLTSGGGTEEERVQHNYHFVKDSEHKHRSLSELARYTQSFGDPRARRRLGRVLAAGLTVDLSFRIQAVASAERA